VRQLYVRKKCEEIEKIGIDSKRLLEVVLERLPLTPKKQPLRIRTQDWTHREEGKAYSPA